MRNEGDELSERKKLILKAIVDAHIDTGEPVGSKFLAQHGHIVYSSATIRNEMAELESMGYLEQPHTSAGRVPSETGYRFYVDSLLERYRMTSEEIDRLKSALKTKQSELDSVLSTAMRLASSMTNYTALALKPASSGMGAKRYEIITVDERTLLLVMILEGGTARTRTVKSGTVITPEASAALSMLLNERLSGITPDMITMPVLMEMERRMGEYDYLVSPVVKAVCEMLGENGGGELRFDGVNRLLSYPDYYDFDRLRQMIELFERKNDLLSAITARSMSGEDKSDGVQVYIGSENMVKIMDNSTLVLKPVKKDGRAVGAIGIIGPTRMDYGRVISMVDSLTEEISDLMSSAPPGDAD